MLCDLSLSSSFRTYSFCYALRCVCESLDAAEYVTEQFYEAGLAPRETHDLKLHITLINTRHRFVSLVGPLCGGLPACLCARSCDCSCVSASRQPESEKRIPFDASDIMKRYGDIDFGSVKITYSSLFLSLSLSLSLSISISLALHLIC
jgi:hypothetical protein